MSEKPMPSESERGNKEDEAAHLSRLVRMDIAEQLKNMAESLKSGDAGSAPGAQGDGAHHANQATDDGHHTNQATDDGHHANQQNDSTTQSQQSDQVQPNGSAQGDAGQQSGDIGQTILGDLAQLARDQAEKVVEQVIQETLSQIDQIRLDMFRPE